MFNIDDVKRKFKFLVEEDLKVGIHKIQNAINYQSKFYDNLIIFSSQIIRLNRSYKMQSISYENYNVNIIKIQEGVIYIINTLKIKDLKHDFLLKKQEKISVVNNDSDDSIKCINDLFEVRIADLTSQLSPEIVIFLFVVKSKFLRKQVVQITPISTILNLHVSYLEGFIVAIEAMKLIEIRRIDNLIFEVQGLNNGFSTKIEEFFYKVSKIRKKYLSEMVILANYYLYQSSL